MNKKIIFFGTPLFLQSAVNTCLKKDCVIRLFLSEKSRQDAVTHLKHFPEKDIIFYQSVNDQTVFDKVTSFKPDYIFSCILSEKISDNLIKAPKNGAFNIHPSLLPNYRGPSPWFWTIYNEEKESGITLHYLTQEWDKGDIVAQIKFNLDQHETIGTYSCKVALYIPKLLNLFFDLSKKNTLQFSKQSRGNYQRKPSTNIFKIDWSKTASQIKAHVQAANPAYPCEAVILQGLYTIREVDITDIPSTKPGEILVKDRKLLIGASDYYLEIRILFSKYNGFFSGERFVSFTKLKET